jgi:hypothetical protein
MSSAFDLTLLVGPGVPLPVPKDVVDSLTQAQVTVSSGARTGFQLTFAVSKDSLLTRVLLPAGYFDPPIRVILVATVRGVPHVLSDGVITRQELAPSNTPGQSTLTVTGEDLTVLMDVIDLKIPYPGLPQVAIVALILAKYAVFGIVPVPIPPFYSDLRVPIEGWITQTETDLAMLNRLAAAAGYVFYLEPGPAPGMSLGYWGPEIRVGIPQPALNVNMDAETNVESLAFSYDGLSKTLPVLFVQIPEVKVPMPIPVPDVAPWRPPLAVRPAIPLKVELLDDTASMSPGEAVMYGLAKASKSSDAISGSGSLDVLRYGQPLSARGLVGVRGAGLAYDGLYYVKSVTHKIKAGEYKQSFELSRNGLISTVPQVAA